MNSSATLGPESKDGKVTGIDAGDKKPEGKPAAQEIQTSESKEPGFLDTIVGFFKLKEEKAPESTEVKPDEKKLPRKTTPQIEESPFKENTNDGVDQKLFKPEKPISDSDEELAPFPNSEYRKKKQKAPAKNDYKIQLKKKRR